MWIRLLLMLVLLGGGLGGLFYWKIEQGKQQAAAMAERKMPPFAVEAATVQAETWPTGLSAIGTLRAVNGGDIKAETAGRVKTLNFDSGKEVQKGDLLVQLDDEVERAELRSYQAQLKLARLDYQRGLKLIKQKSIAESTLDQDRARLEEAQAGIARIQAVIEKKQIRAPFSGRLGLREIDPGEYINIGQTISKLQALDPLLVDFLLPEKYLPKLQTGQTADIHLDAFPGQTFQARLNAVDAEVDSATRHIKVQARLTNPEYKLLPGMFAEVSVLLPESNEVISIPQTAVSYSLYGDAVFVIEGEGEALQVKRRYIKLGRLRGERIAILDGLQVGERVVSAGQMKLRDGAAVQIKTSEPSE